MIKAVLFDLDDTLLELNLTAFVGRYALGASDLLAQAARRPTPPVALAFSQALLATEDAKRADSLSNEQLFCERFGHLTGIPMDDPAFRDLMATFDRDVVPTYKDGIVRARPKAGARETVDKVHEMGLVCALATNPTFSIECDRVRMGWAGIREEDFALVSTWSNSTRVKPHAQYYQEFVDALGLTLNECLMVGNDIRRDFAKPEECGLRTAYVGHARPQRAVWCGTLTELAKDLPALIARLDAADARRA